MAACHSEEFEQVWIKKQTELKKTLITHDDIDWSLDSLHLIGGVDISFPKDDDEHACPGLIVVSYPDLKIVYEDFSLEHLEVQYVSHFLAFREVPLLKDKIDKLKGEHPELMPQVIMVDGNGLHHRRGFGIACHLGVVTGMPTIGVAKSLLQIDGISSNEAHRKQVMSLVKLYTISSAAVVGNKKPTFILQIQKKLRNKGDQFPLKGTSDIPTAMVLRSSKPPGSSPCKPIYVSVGHRVGLATAVDLVLKCCKFRIPEPTRQADILSRKYIRENYEKELGKCSCKCNNNGKS